MQSSFDKTLLKQNKHKRQHKQQGLALISIVLLTALVLASIVGITATLAITAKQTTTDQMMTLRAQYAAESGLSLAKLRLTELEDVVNLANYPNSLTTLDDHALDFCGLPSYTNRPTPSSDWSNAQRINGFELCKAKDLAGSNVSNRLSILSKYITKADMETLNITSSPGKYWEELFASTMTSSKILQTNSEGTVRFEIDYNIQPSAVRLLQDGLSMRFVFALGNVIAKGTIEDSDGNLLAVRQLELQPNATELYLEVSKPSFAHYGYFADTRLAPSGGQIYFKDGNYIGGRVHINRDVGFASTTTTGGPRFSGKFSTAQTAIRWLSGSPIVNDELMFLGGSEFGAQEIELPINNHIQRDKALGVNGITDNNEICAALNLAVDATPEGCETSGSKPIIADGIYYTAGDGIDQPNVITNPFFGGIFIQGDVDDIQLSIENNRQVISIIHRNGSQVTFTQQRDAWQIEDSTVDGGNPETIPGNFNGLIFVDGKVGCDNRRDTAISNYADDQRTPAHYADGSPMCASTDNGLKGDGTDKADIQKDFMLTVTATGNINIKDDITYETISQCANQPEDTFNVLGVFTPKGNIKVDGVYNKNLNIHGAFMASEVDHGFGTLDFAVNRGSDINIILHGSVIHHTDQGVGTFNGSTGQNISGYGREWTFDCRLANGFAPPFFPTQNEWDKLTSFNGLNNRSTWRLR